MKDLYYGCVMINKIHERPLLWMCHGRCIHTKINKIHERPLLWMCHGRCIHTKINKIHERPLLWMCHGRCIHTKINKIHYGCKIKFMKESFIMDVSW